MPKTKRTSKERLISIASRFKKELELRGNHLFCKVCQDTVAGANTGDVIHASSRVTDHFKRTKPS